MADDQEQATPDPEEPQDQPAADDQTKAELERTRIALKAANKESAERRKRLEQLEADEAARQQAAMTETDRLKAEIEQAKADAAKAQATARETLIRAAFVAEAAKAGAAHPEDVYLLADRSAVDVGDSGAVEGAAEAVKALVDAGRVPLLGRQQAPNLDGGAGGGDRQKAQVKLTQAEMDAARAMNITPEKYAAQKAAIQGRPEQQE